MPNQKKKTENNIAPLHLSLDLKELLIETAKKLKSSDRRMFMAKTVNNLGKGGQRKAEAQLGWNRSLIRKGQKELINGPIEDKFYQRGRKRAEHHLPNLLEDIKSIVEPGTQIDPTFRTNRLYTPLTANEVRKRLLEDKGYPESSIPAERTICQKLRDLSYYPQKVAKTKPKKKIAETDAIFDQVHITNSLADKTEGVIRISCDAKANIKIGPFSRGGYSRHGTTGCDHDFNPDTVLKLFGIFLPAYDESFFYFTESKLTADFIVDMLENIWPELQRRFEPHTLVINLDNGPENNSARTQFMKRLVEFAHKNEVSLELAYYPPYHSKYNPIERVWGRLENYWNGELLDSVEKVLGLARTMTWKGISPIVHFVKNCYETGVTLTQKAMEKYEGMIERLPKLEKWCVSIPFYED